MKLKEYILCAKKTCKTSNSATAFFTVKFLPYVLPNVFFTVYLYGPRSISVALLSIKLLYFIKNIFIFVSKMDGGLRGVERHEGE